jgi:hypothetical protein
LIAIVRENSKKDLIWIKLRLKQKLRRKQHQQLNRPKFHYRLRLHSNLQLNLHKLMHLNLQFIQVLKPMHLSLPLRHSLNNINLSLLKVKPSPQLL